MPYQILVPTSDRTITFYGKYPATAGYYNKIDDGESHDSASSYVQGYNDPGDNYGSFNVGNPDHIGIISSVEIHAVMKKTSASCTGYGYPAITWNELDFYGPSEVLTTSYQDYSQTWNTNPATSAAWAWSDLDSVILALNLGTDSASYYYAQCTSLYLKVNHTSPSGGGGAQIIGLELL